MCSEFALPQKRTVASRLTRQILCYLEVHPFLLSYFQELWNRKFQAAVNLYWQVTSMCKKLCVIVWKCPYVSRITGKSLSEALTFASTNPQYEDRLFIELQVQYMKIPSSNLGRTCCVQKLFLTFRTIFANNMFSPCSAKRRASDKDLPVILTSY